MRCLRRGNKKRANSSTLSASSRASEAEAVISVQSHQSSSSSSLEPLTNSKEKPPPRAPIETRVWERIVAYLESSWSILLDTGAGANNLNFALCFIFFHF